MATGELGNDKQNDKSKNGVHNESEPKPSELEEQIVRQIEYYFGDINLPKDKFMLEKIKLDDGWIPMSVMLTFQRLSKLTTDPGVVAKALIHSDLMEVDETGDEIKIRRSPENPLPVLDDARRQELTERTVYCARFPLDTGMDELLRYFNTFGPIDNLIMRKFKDKIANTFKFKGSVFVTFRSKEKGQEFLDLETLKYNDADLTKMWQADYVVMKKQEYNERSKRGKKAAEVKIEEMDVSAKNDLPRGATIHLSGAFEGLRREMIKDKFSSLGYDLAFIDFKEGETEAHVRFGDENAGKDFIEKEGSEVTIQNSTLTMRLLEGEEEESFLKTAVEFRNAALKRRQQMKKGGRKSKGGKGFRGARKRKAGKGEDSCHSPPAKKATTA